MKKTLGTLALFAAVIISRCAMADTEVVDGITWTYTISDGKASIAGVSPATGAITIPSVIEGCPVTSIGDYAFQDCSGLTSVTIPEGVASIGAYAFWQCSGMTSVTIPSSVTSIGRRAFRNCTALKSMIIPEGVTSIGSCAFLGCDKLESVSLPNSVTNIEDGAFTQCYGLKSVNLPSALATVDRNMFNWCTSLTNIVIPSSVTTIGISAFYGCYRLTNVVIPNSVTNIERTAFCGCSGLTHLEIPANVASIGEWAFGIYRHPNYIPNSLLSAVDFDGPPPAGLSNAGIDTSAKIRYDIMYADEWLPVFSACGFTNTQPFQDTLVDGGPYNDEVDGLNWTYGIVNKWAILGINNASAIDKATVGNVKIPTSLGHALVTEIDVGAFAGCSEITTLRITASVTNISASAFSGCGKLTAFEVSEDNPTYASVGGLLYDKVKTTLLCVPSGLTEVTIPKETVRIADGAFANCSKLASVTILGTPPSKLDNVFSGTPSSLVVHADATQAGWIQWGGRPLAFDVGTSGGSSSIGINLTVTNVIVHYIQTSEQSPMTAPISQDVGIVNVMTEIKGGNIAISESWAANYPTFAEKFGSDFSTALTTETGKFDAGNNPLLVWHDYVAGTDPTDKDSVFKASVTMVDGKPVVSYTPQLTEAEKAKRKYTTWGKARLQDADWVEVPSGSESDYNFFKVTVEMK